MDISKLKKIYEGKAKIIFESPDPDTYIQYFKNEVTAFNDKKKGAFENKGALNNMFSSYFMESLQAVGIGTHFIKKINNTSQLVHRVKIIPIEVIVRFVVAGSLKRLGLTEGQTLDHPLIEFNYKSDSLNDPLLTYEHISLLQLASKKEMDWITCMALRIADYLSGLLYSANIKLIDIKLEFGRIANNNNQIDIILADEISPDTCRLWDINTNERFDKDVFRYDLADLITTYQKLAKRLALEVNYS